MLSLPFNLFELAGYPEAAVAKMGKIKISAVNHQKIIFHMDFNQFLFISMDSLCSPST